LTSSITTDFTTEDLSFLGELGIEGDFCGEDFFEGDLGGDFLEVAFIEGDLLL